jgi:SAM-dependent methyltransferase
MYFLTLRLSTSKEGPRYAFVVSLKESMFDPQEKDFEAIEAWGLKANPLRAIEDYSPLKAELRWLNPYHREAHDAYYSKREAYIEQKNFDHYYKKTEKPIDRRRWEYLKARKAWYILPLEWERFADREVTRILDLGCGDGDVTQRLADYVADCWQKQGHEGHKIDIYGYDLNESRVRNAKQHCRSPHPYIRFHFEACDAIGKGISHPERFFDYAVTTGVFEILEDVAADQFMAEMCRVTGKGIYVEDLADRYPGGYPRDTFEEMFRKCGFALARKQWVLSEPFSLEGAADPMQLWPILRSIVLFATRK